VRAAHQHDPSRLHRLAAYRAAGGYALLRECVAGNATSSRVISTLEASGLRGLGGAGFPGRPQVAHRARRSRARA
jgi:NADH:ubiquinone oxidoreductase subunit F (NADH-binding)